MKIIARSDKGLVRHNNQDSFSSGEFPDGCVWATVCDGMGGANGGNVASAMAVKIIAEQLTASYQSNMTDNSIKNLLESAVNAANISIYNQARRDTELSGMGTTVVLALVKNAVAYIVHAGDSRAYIFNSQSIRQVTKDHSVVQTLIDKGQLTASQAKSHPSKNIITRALGVSENIKIEFDVENLPEGECLLICSDGLTNFLDIDDIFNEVKDNKYYAYAQRLVDKANENGGGDNITVVVIANVTGE